MEQHKTWLGQSPDTTTLSTKGYIFLLITSVLLTALLSNCNVMSDWCISKPPDMNSLRSIWVWGGLLLAKLIWTVLPIVCRPIQCLYMKIIGIIYISCTMTCFKGQTATLWLQIPHEIVFFIISCFQTWPSGGLVMVATPATSGGVWSSAWQVQYVRELKLPHLCW